MRVGKPAESHVMTDPKQRLPFSNPFFIGLVVAGIAALLGLRYMLTTAIEMVCSGRGLETYRTFWLVESNCLSFLTLVAVTVMAPLIAGMMRFREFLLWRSLEKRYGDINKD